MSAHAMNHFTILTKDVDESTKLGKTLEIQAEDALHRLRDTGRVGRLRGKLLEIKLD